MKKGKLFKFQAFTSMLSCTLVLVLVGLTVFTVLAAHNASNYLRENFIVTLTLGGSNDAILGTDEGMPAQIADMQHGLSAERYVRGVKLITADEVLQQQSSVIGGNPEDFLGFNPYYSELEIELQPQYANSDSMQVLTKELTTKYPLVSEVGYERELMDNLGVNIGKLAFSLLAITGLMLVILLTLINNMVRLSVYARRFHIHTMKLVGASWGFIRRPFMMRSLWIGIVSAILASIILAGFAFWLKSYDEMYAPFIQYADLLYVILVVFVFGLTLLLLSTYISVNHFLKMKEHRLHT